MSIVSIKPQLKPRLDAINGQFKTTSAVRVALCRFQRLIRQGPLTGHLTKRSLVSQAPIKADYDSARPHVNAMWINICATGCKALRAPQSTCSAGNANTLLYCYLTGHECLVPSKQILVVFYVGRQTKLRLHYEKKIFNLLKLHTFI